MKTLNIEKPLYPICVIGDGPAGILAIAALLKKQVPAKNILWIGKAR